MRWPAFFILAYVFVGLQVGLGGVVRHGGAGVNLVLLAAVFVAMHARREPALIGCFVLGLMQDLVTQQPLGLYALAYSLSGVVMIGAQHVVYREHPLTHVAMALVAGMVVAVLVLVQGWVNPPGPARRIDELVAVPAIGAGAGAVLLTGVYTAVAAPVVLFVLQRLRGLFAFEPSRKRRF
jgi:rod shape-determining protein MreD